MNTAVSEEFARLTVKKRALEADLRAVEERLRGVEEVLSAQMIDSRTQRLTIGLDDAGVQVTLYLQRERWAKATDPEALAAALRANGLGAMIKPESVNTQTLSAYVREQVDGGMEIPADVSAAIEVTEAVRVRGRIAPANEQTAQTA